MRALNQLPVPRDNSAQFPFSTIQNETDTQQGTPVVREIYGDLLTNMYKLLQDVGLTPTGTEDSDTTQYQILQAMKLLANDLNDVVQPLALSGSVWSVNFDFDNLPNNYVFFARVSDAYAGGVSYTISGSGNNTYTFTSSTGFNASDLVLVILDQTGVNAVSLSQQEESHIPVPMSNPISYNDSNTIYYLQDGVIYSNRPSLNNVQAAIQGLGNANNIVVDAIVRTGKLICLVLDPTTDTYSLYSFDISDLNTPTLVTLSGFTFSTAADNVPYLIANATHVYLTNDGNANANDNVLSQFTYNASNNTLTYVADITLNASFQKTTSVFALSDAIITFINNTLTRWNFNGSVQQLGTYNITNGSILSFRDAAYYTNDDVAIRWQL